jgi:hypothetical protein
MTVLSLSFAYWQYTSTVAAVPAQTPATAPAPAPAPAPAAAPDGRRHAHGCDSPRRSPLVRALMDALEATVHTAAALSASGGTASTASTVPAAATDGVPAATDHAATTTPGAATAATGTTSDDSAAGLDHALMEFARALAQALRSDGDRGERAHGHHHPHGHRQWGDSAQRVQQLGTQLGAASPAHAPASPTAGAAAAGADSTAPAAADTAAAEPATVKVGDQVLDPAAVATADIGSTTTQGSMLIVTAELKTQIVSSTGSRNKDRLLDAFANLQRALGQPQADDRDSLKTQLSAFLRELAHQLSGSGDPQADATQPGSLISVQA